MLVQKPLRDAVREALETFGTDPELIERRNLPLFHDAAEVTIAEVGKDGREHLLTPSAAQGWRDLRQAADNDGVSIYIVSAYRSFQRQVEIIEASIVQGRSVDELFQHVAPPGCSEHHTGKAVDLGTPECEDLTEEFARTDAFYWLDGHAEAFNCRLSFPKNNAWGYFYEPWHWCFA